jgi:hypothetical protein
MVSERGGRGASASPPRLGRRSLTLNPKHKTLRSLTLFFFPRSPPPPPSPRKSEDLFGGQNPFVLFVEINDFWSFTLNPGPPLQVFLSLPRGSGRDLRK